MKDNNIKDNNIIDNCIKKILENINQTSNGTIIASPSKENPNYFYHWVRDSAIIMKVIIMEYEKTKELKYIDIMLKYIDCEYKLMKLFTLSGLGEPKFNTDLSCFNEMWWRPQNDGPVLRGIMLIKIANILKEKYSFIIDKINTMIEENMKYTIDNLDNPSYDLWEEIYGYHFYTRIITAKFIKEYVNYKNKNINTFEPWRQIKEYISHHLSSEKVISSFNTYGSAIRYSDASIFMCLNHIDYDNDIFPHNNYKLIENNINELVNHFNKKFINNENMIGRYCNDKYFDGKIWIICTISLLSFYKFNRFYLTEHIEDIIFNKIKSLGNFNLAEQYDPDEDKFYSAKQLTWNYSEIYFYLSI